MTGRDISAGFSREKSRPFSRPFPCAQPCALGVPCSGGPRFDLRLTNTSAPLWKTFVQPRTHGRLRPCHARQQLGRRWILVGHFTAPDDMSRHAHWVSLTRTDMLSPSLTRILWGRYLSSSFSDDEPEGQTRYMTSSTSPVAAWQLRDAPTPTPRSAWHRAGGVGGASRPCQGAGWSAHPSGIYQAYF